jgi:hypothetical protein
MKFPSTRSIQSGGLPGERTHVPKCPCPSRKTGERRSRLSSVRPAFPSMPGSEARPPVGLRLRRLLVDKGVALKRDDLGLGDVVVGADGLLREGECVARASCFFSSGSRKRPGARAVRFMRARFSMIRAGWLRSTSGSRYAAALRNPSRKRGKTSKSGIEGHSCVSSSLGLRAAFRRGVGGDSRTPVGFCFGCCWD